MASYQKLLEELLKSEEMDDPNNLVVCEKMQSEDMRSEVTESLSLRSIFAYASIASPLTSRPTTSPRRRRR